MLNKEEFEKRIIAIDRELIKEDLPIYARPLNAMSRYAEKYKVGFPIAGLDLLFDNESYDEMNLARKIHQWYENKYRDRLKKDFSRGKIAVLISGDIFRLKIPLIFGKALFLMDANDSAHEEISNDGTMILNLFDFLDGFNKELGKELTIEDCNEIVLVFKCAMVLFEILKKEKNTCDLCAAAEYDFENAVESLLIINRNIGQSKWSSLQAAEKIFKSVLQRNNIPFGKIHKLDELSLLLYQIGFPKIDDDIINTIQCSAEVRYSFSNYKLKDAIKAHYYSIYISKEVLSFRV